MHWRELKTAGYIEITGERAQLSHLKDRRYNWIIPASGKHPEIQFNALVQFGSHCVSVGPRRGLAFNFDDLGHSHRIIDEKGIHRKFCPNRYTLATNLPRIFDTFLDRICRFTNHENFMVVDMLNASGKQVRYEIFFNVTRQGRKFLRIFVESAFARNDGTHAPSYKKKIRASALLAKKLRQEAIRRP